MTHPRSRASRLQQIPLNNRMPKAASGPKRRGFTLIETIVTVGLIAVLAAFVVPSVIEQGRAERWIHGRDIQRNQRTGGRDSDQWPDRQAGGGGQCRH